MAQRRLGGYTLDIDDAALADRYSANLDLYANGMMVFAHKDVRLQARDELALLEAIARDLALLIEERRAAVDRLDKRKHPKA